MRKERTKLTSVYAVKDTQATADVNHMEQWTGAVQQHSSRSNYEYRVESLTGKQKFSKRLISA